MSRMKRGFAIKRESVFESAAGSKEEQTLAGAIKEEGVIVIYDAFFKKAVGDEIGLNARSTVLMHEFGHLTGMGGDAEAGSFESPECLRNFALLECKIVSPDNLFGGGNPDSDDLDDTHARSEIGKYGELPFNPDQPRVPKGSEGGGQWTSSEGGNASSESEESDKKGRKKSSDENSESAKGSPPKSKKEISQKAAKTLENAKDKVGSREWARATAKDNFGEGTNKCNKFVADVLEESGVDVPDTAGGIPIWRTNKPYANQWADRDFEIKGFDVVDEPQEGDIVAFQNPDGLGHVGIVSGDDKYISAGEEQVTEADIDVDGKINSGRYTDVVYRRIK